MSGMSTHEQFTVLYVLFFFFIIKTELDCVPVGVTTIKIMHAS